MAIAPGQAALHDVVAGGAAALYTMPAWSAGWTYQPDLRFLRATAAVAGHDLGRLEFEVDYGTLLRTGATALITRAPSDFIGHWVRLVLIGPQGMQPVWIGRIDAERRTIFGGYGAGRTGRQRFVAYSPLRILQKRTISSSWWWEQAAAVEVEWMPAFNHRDVRKLVFGNATAAKQGDSHLFGGNSIWTHLMALEYVVERFVQEGGVTGPRWTLGGDLDVLERISDAIPVGDSITAAALIAKLIPRRLGLAWDIVLTPDGFEIRVFPMLARTYTFGGVTLPANPSRVRVSTAAALDWRIDLVESTDHVYNRIEIRGKRMVVCCTIAGTKATVKHTGGLVPRWATGKVTQYDDPLPTEGEVAPEDLIIAARDRDEARKMDHLATIYRLYGVPDNWDFNAGTATPTVKADGTVAKGTPSPKKQTAVRATLPWLPLFRDYDYTTDPPKVENTATQFSGDLVPPTVWVKDLTTKRWALADEVGIAVSVTRQMLGVYLQPDTMAHVLAKNHITFDDFEESLVFAKYDYDDLIATLAFESDVRAGIVLERAGGTPSGGVLTIEVDAELWYMAPNTVVRVTAGANASVFQTAAGVVLRDDIDKLKLAAAGAIARYWERRRRGAITLEGLRPVDMLGRVVVVDDGGRVPALESPVTSIEWIAPANETEGPRSVAAETGPLTILHLGYGL